MLSRAHLRVVAAGRPSGWLWTVHLGEVDYVPVPSKLCDLCAARREDGKKALCELHCLANVIEILPAAEAAKRMVELGSKTTCFIP